MPSFFYLVLYGFAILLTGPVADSDHLVAPGHLPVVVAEPSGKLHLTFGQDSAIYYATTSTKTASFGTPTVVAVLPNLVAGAKRGPQIAVTAQYVVISAVNRAGDLFAYSLDRATGRWSSAVRMNDVPQIAKEGFQAVAGASRGVFHAAWLDLRDDKKNKIVGTTSRDGGRTWSANHVIYRSPDGTVCECCRVSMAAKNNDVYVQFRNWLDGSRNLYLAHSTDGGKTYAPAQKLGTGTWPLKACPMDGGAVAVSAAGQPFTAWRRENTLYTCQPGEPEQAIATGRNVTLTAGSTGPLLAWDDAGTVWVKSGNKPAVSVGKGQMPSVAVAGKTAVCVWELEGKVMTGTVGL
ncbi:sialidase family protein [Larkinella sp.]|uniref:sialidase family protein n=1 Tax=Larkinella sp. TaxID=2034517 RepID=UPI003BAB211B